MPIFSIARLTILDLIRRRVLVLLALFAVGLILLSFPLREFTVGQWRRLISDIGLGSIDLCITLLAVFLGASLIAGDLDRKTLYPLLSKPLSRASFISGKFLGLAAVLLFLGSVMVLGTWGVLWVAGEHGSGVLFQNLATISVSGFVMGAIAIFFSSFTSVTLAGSFSLAILLAGHLTSNLAFFSQRVPFALGRLVMRGLAGGLPDLEALNLKDFAAHGQLLPLQALLPRLAYGLTYAAAAVSLAAAVFVRRDLK